MCVYFESSTDNTTHTWICLPKMLISSSNTTNDNERITVEMSDGGMFCYKKIGFDHLGGITFIIHESRSILC